MFARKKSIVGLDVGTSEIKAVELTNSGGNLKITGFGSARVQAPDQIGETIIEVLRNAGIKTRRVATAVSGRSVVARYINLPLMTESEIKGALRFEADKYIPFDIEEVALDGHKLEEIASSAEEGDKEMKVLMVAAKKSLVHDHVRMIQDIGLIPVVVDVDTFALGNAFELRNRYSSRVEERQEVVALVDVGATKTNISILLGNTTYFSREVYLGGNDLTEAVARRLAIETTEAEDLKRNPQGREAELEEALTTNLDDLANEIHLSFDYFENQFDREVGEIFVSGGCVRTPGLQTVFERVFDRKIQFWDPTENLELRGDRIDPEELKAHASQLPVAIGLGARLLDPA
ncbi:MAG: pilus assembly protein PilM [Planctomycetes bacterium]|nr:pilus assembly protein PilM [Planctomycetota bacterium]